jgi:hypothetical protein
MHKLDPHQEMEAALLRLMPTALSDGAQNAMEAQIDELSGSEVVHYRFFRWASWLGGIAAVLTISFVVFSQNSPEATPLAKLSESGMIILTELDRVENFHDEGLFVDAGGSAVRKLRVHVVGESRIRDEETGIEVTLTEPREEMVLMPVSTF